jgi:tetratricopeptide (TPR) repeat protein
MATKAQKVTALRRGAVLVFALGALAAGGWIVHALRLRSAVLGGLPAPPDASGLPRAFAEQLDAARRDAGGLFGPIEGLRSLSRLYHANGFYDEALQCYQTLRRLEPKEARWPHLEAAILAQFGRMDEARAREAVATVLAPRYLAARLRLGDELLKSNQTKAAFSSYEEALKIAPDDPYASLGEAKCNITDGKWEAARESLDGAIRKHPDFVGALELQVTVAEHFGDQAAADTLNQLIGTREFVDLPDPWLDGLMDDCFDAYRLSVAATVANFSGNRPRAERLLERALALAPNTGAFQRELAVFLSNDGDFAGARSHLEKAVALAPGDNDAWLLLYQLLARMGEAQAASRALSDGLANCPLSASLRLERGRRLMAAGLVDEAIAEFREAYRLKPSEAGPLVELARALFAARRGDEAVDALHEALKRQPEEPMALATLTFYSISTGDEQAALGWWAHVRRQPRTPQPMLDSLRQAYQQRFGRPLP